MKVTKVREFASRLLRRLPGVKVVEDPPARAGGVRFLDASYRGRSAVIQWHPRKGFGLSRSQDAAYGDGPHETYPDPVSTARRTGELLLRGAYTSPPTEAPIARIRLLRGFTQQELARRLKVGQAAVSKLERKKNVRLETLRRIVHALGARLVLRVEWNGGSVELKPSDSPGNRTRRTVGRRYN